MAFDPNDDASPPPEDPRLRSIRRLVTILLAVLVVGTATVVGALLIALRSVMQDAAPTDAAPEIVGVRPGERLIGAEIGEGRLVLMLEDASGASRAILFDATTLEPIGAIQVEPVQ